MSYIIEANSVAYLDHYFFQKPQHIPEADPATFKAISKWFAIDCNHIYFLYNVVDGADPSSFVYLGGSNCHWAKDKAFAYYFWPSKQAKNWKRLESKNLNSFQILSGCRFNEYALDDENVFYMGKKIRGADAKFFHIMTAEQIEDGSTSPSHHFAKDGACIYFDGKLIKDIDYERFTVLHVKKTTYSEYGTDGVKAFFYDWARTRMVTVSHQDLPASLQEHFRKY